MRVFFTVKWKFVVATSNSNIGWTWIPKDGTSGVWGYIHHSEAGYLTMNQCNNGTCTLRMDPNQVEFEGQLWRKWKNKIISKRFLNKQVVVLTLDSNENVVAMQPNDDENQDWSLI